MVCGLSRWAVVLLRGPAGVPMGSCRPVSCSEAAPSFIAGEILLMLVSMDFPGSRV